MRKLTRQQRWPVSIVLGCLVASHAVADSGRVVLTREHVVELARRSAPTVRIAETRIAESRGRIVGARVLLPENPVVELLAGPRWADRRTTDVEVTLAVPVQLGGRREKRIASAEAALDRDSSLARDAQRTTVGDAVAAYYRILHAQARVELGQARKALADDLLKTATDRKQAGDVAQLEVNLASAEVSRAESEVLSEQGNLARARAQLAVSLGLGSGESIDVQGRLDDRTSFDAIAANAPNTERADVTAARAEVSGAASDVSLADALRWPELSFRVGYKREDQGTDILIGGFAVSLPVFERGQGARAEARARQDRASIELGARRSVVTVEIEAARVAYRAAVDAVARLEDKGLRLAIENETMARESYRVGKIDLATLLIVRREALDTRREHLERLLEAALAGVDVSVAVGALP
jgi:cobalt-zinc-cadmium efflux system outer membrane protein